MRSNKIILALMPQCWLSLDILYFFPLDNLYSLFLFLLFFRNGMQFSVYHGGCLIFLYYIYTSLKDISRQYCVRVLINLVFHNM